MTMLNVPWWGKICAKIILSRSSFGYAVWQRLGLFRHGQMDTSAYAIRVFNSHVEKAGLTHNLQGKSILELGPGDSIATAIIAAAHGAHATMVDAGAFVRSDIKPYLDLVNALAQLDLPAPDLSSCRNVEEILACCNARYLTEGLTSLSHIETHSIDLIFSQAVLEHVRRAEFLQTMQHCRRILKVGGTCSHQIDLRDHLGGSLNNLRFSEKLWESSFFSRSGFYTNRIQYSKMLDLFERAGFGVCVTGVRRWDTLPIRRTNLSKKFKALTDEELCICEFDVLLK